MSSWLQTASLSQKAPGTLTITHNSGFFSCCSFRLEKIVEYYNRYKVLPVTIDSSEQFTWYKPSRCEDYFLETVTTRISSRSSFENWMQFMSYKTLQFSSLTPFVQKYFSPTEEIQKMFGDLVKKYNVDLKNTCVLFHRGNDKITETPSAPYNDYISRGKEILTKNPKIRFLVQSDEQEFIDAMLKAFPKSAFTFKDETRAISKANTSVDIVFKDKNYLYSKYFLATTLIMSRCSTIICGSGNCSLWVTLYRGNTDGMQQYLKGRWV